MLYTKQKPGKPEPLPVKWIIKIIKNEWINFNNPLVFYMTLYLRTMHKMVRRFFPEPSLYKLRYSPSFGHNFTIS